MAAIATSFGTGGSGLQPGGSGGVPSLATALRDIALDLAAIKGAAPVATITGVALPAFTDPPSAVEMAAVRALVNELRASAIEVRAARVTGAGVTLLTTAP
jgi:proteasome assembly chaperone (PAC2) family protein